MKALALLLAMATGISTFFKPYKLAGTDALRISLRDFPVVVSVFALAGTFALAILLRFLRTESSTPLRIGLWSYCAVITLCAGWSLLVLRLKGVIFGIGGANQPYSFTPFFYWIFIVILFGVVSCAHLAMNPERYLSGPNKGPNTLARLTPQSPSFIHQGVKISLGPTESRLVPADHRRPEVGEAIAQQIALIFETEAQREVVQINGTELKNGKNILGESSEILIHKFGLKILVHDIEWDPSQSTLISLSFSVLN